MLFLALAIAAFPLPYTPPDEVVIWGPMTEVVGDDDVLYTVGTGTTVSEADLDVVDFRFVDEGSTGIYYGDPTTYVVAHKGKTIATFDAKTEAWRLEGRVDEPPPLLNYVSWTGFFLLMMLLVRMLWTTPMMSTAPAQPPPAEPDGLLDRGMTAIFGRSWRTGIAGLTGAALTIVAAWTTIEAPVTWEKVAPLLPSIAMSLGLMGAKDARVSHTQLPKT